jgi:hypothetical protein
MGRRDMKRNKMVELMYNTICNNYSHSDLDLSISEVEKLLTVMEEAGMLPPMSPNWEYVEAPWNKGIERGFTVKYKWEEET